MQTDYVKGDDRPIIRDQLTRGRATIPLSSNDTVHLYIEDPEGEIFIADQATIADRPESRVEYEMDGGWPLEGTYLGRWVINYDDGGTQTVPNGSPKEITVWDTLNRDADVRDYDDPDISVSNVWTDHLGANTAQAVTVGSPLDLGGNDISGIGSADAESLNAGSAEISGQTAATENWVESSADVSSLNGLTFDDVTGDSRYYTINSGNGTEYFKLVSLKDKSSGTNGGGAIRCQLHFAEGRGGSPIRTVDFYIFAKGDAFSAEYTDYGQHFRNDNVDFVVTEDPGDGSATDHQYHVYVRADTFLATGVSVTPGQWFGSHDWQAGLSETDLIGTTVYDTGAQEPDRVVRAGEMYSSGDRVATREWVQNNFQSK
ncbi:hypothetical protein HTZ84_05245 [Haloterrigena sp. SYSU A558-1]|uniref:Uncharacterized protein n=1 Tax=Haloterrigena gelatinilytica TaxID=2741724 RepID=A0ABX2L956_9EURY|nr:hypothetical protein [Haloterrigena gelatinilytica]NUC71719.1 hypothetical protein [Haloterrigena gelatinilytica]